MKILRITVIVIFVAVTAVFLRTYIGEKLNYDETIPVITVDSDIIEVSFRAGDEELKQGVTATDGKDGDITDKVIVESVSAFIEKGVCKVNYAVCDSDNHVSTASRKVRYTDYTSPEFFITDSTCFSLYDSIDVSQRIHCKDCIEGNIDRKMILTSPDYVAASTGIFTIEANVTNNKGDTSTLSIPLYVEDRPAYAPTIKLREYLVYLEQGGKLNPKKYLSSAADTEGVNLTSKVRIENKLDPSKEGMQSIHYYVTDDRGVEGHTVLNVYVTGK